jgi:catechol 2,3-dioxygenase-like lactoylglutathione lyase family enzyme
MSAKPEYTDEDVGNIVLLEHVNLRIPDQAMATLFYVVALGFTRDPYLTVGLENMWINVGEQQFHLPTGTGQVIPGHIGVVVPDIESLNERLKASQEQLKDTQFAWSVKDDYVALTCPWGNHFRCYHPGSTFNDMALGIPYVEFLVRPGAAKGIARFYEEVMRAPSVVGSESGIPVAGVGIGRNQWLFFRETSQEIPPYDGHHIAVYVANFSGPYRFLKKRNLIMEDVRNHQFRFKDVVDPENGEKLFEVEHEVRSLRHPMYHRSFVNRNPEQTQRNYKRGRDNSIPFGVS